MNATRTILSDVLWRWQRGIAGACPNATPASGCVERQVQVTLSKCKDPTALGPRFACG